MRVLASVVAVLSCSTTALAATPINAAQWKANRESQAIARSCHYSPDPVRCYEFAKGIKVPHRQTYLLLIAGKWVEFVPAWGYGGPVGFSDGQGGSSRGPNLDPSALEKYMHDSEATARTIDRIYQGAWGAAQIAAGVIAVATTGTPTPSAAQAFARAVAGLATIANGVREVANAIERGIAGDKHGDKSSNLGW